MRRRLVWVAFSIVSLGLLLLACTGQSTTETAKTTPPATLTIPEPSAPSSTPSSASLGSLRLLKTSPERGPVGTSITLTGDGLPSGKVAEIIWVTVDGSYKTGETKAGLALGVEYNGRVYVPKRVSLGRATIAGDGKVTATFIAPEDYGELHDIYLAVDGQDVAKGGYRLMRSFIMTPVEGPVGTVITIKVTALGSKAFESTAALRYDNKYTGFISATTTRGTAVFQFRAAGPVGKHYISVDPASHAQPFLNIKTGALSTRHLLPFEQAFTVTKDNGPPSATIDWPDLSRVAKSDGWTHIPSMGQITSTPGVSASLSPNSGPVLTKTTVKVSGLSPGAVNLLWVTTRRSDPLAENRTASSDEPSVASMTVGQSGSAQTSVTIPEGVGGWHVVKVVQNNKVLAEVPFYVEQSLVTPVPVRVKAGEKFTVWFRGGGWTELDNGAAVTYDNAYIGYACGFAYNGDTPIELVATGGPGTHLIDIYPYIFDGNHGDWPWQYNMPQLTYAQDHPGLSLGYKFPAYRIAIEIIP
ncbi:MAG: cadherin repeat domain-containing protein [Chloroflexi bacterium]|nr:cadherin repeat domain-containing protein [Chloroflexota bacterium]